MRKSGSYNYSTCKRVLNLLEAICLRLLKIVVQIFTVVKFEVDNIISTQRRCVAVIKGGRKRYNTADARRKKGKAWILDIALLTGG